jgi:hypothetical protein
MPNGIWSLELPSLALDPAGHQDVLGNFAGDRHASFRPQTPEDVQKIVRERERSAIRKYFLFYRPDLLHFSAFFVTGDNFVFAMESFGAVSAILNSDNETMWITHPLNRFTDLGFGN